MPSRTLLTALLATGALLAALIQLTPDPRHTVLPTPSIPLARVIGTTGSSARFHAPPDAIWRIVLDFPAYAAWSSKVRLSFPADAPLRPGVVGSITSAPTAPGKVPPVYGVEVLIVDHAARTLAWRALLPVPAWLLAAERVQQVVELPGQPGWCEYRVWDSWSGPLAYLMQWTVKKGKKEELEFWVRREMKGYVEAENVGAGRA